jgi:hypothetical protein
MELQNCVRCNLYNTSSTIYKWRSAFMRKLVFMLILSLLTVFATHSNAASVYIATNSRTYHCDRNCPELNTDNVIEFNSPKEADVVGAIPCRHCKLTTGKPNYNVRNVLPNPVITNGSLGEFKHGTFPSPPLGDFTHVGVDLIAACGSDVYTFADGQVKEVIDNTNDEDYKTLGYMVLIEHPASLIGKKFYTLYLHMQGSPEVKIGDQVKSGSTVIGKVGDTGKAFGCHTHFEIRYFPERYSKWGNIYGPGDQQASEYLKQNWEDPLAFFRKYPTGLKLDKSDERDNNMVKVETENDNQEKQSIVDNNATQTEVISNEGVYVGDIKDGKKNGWGTFTWPNGNKYVGVWKDDKKHGRGTLTAPDDRKYIGEWKDDKQHGQGTMTWSDGKKYIGEYKNGKKHGHGTYILSGGTKLVGEWKNGALPEHGTTTLPNGDKYVGDLKNGKKHGQGTYAWPDGSKYVGEWKDNKQHGYGTNTWPDDQKYVGEHRDGKKHGHGTLTLPSGTKLVGEWKNGAMPEHGTTTLPNGDKYVGDLKNGKKHGQGTYAWSDGSKYVGEWKDNKHHGQGTKTWPDGKEYVGEWKDGKRYDSSFDRFISKSSKQTSVYSTKNSREYHMRNCSKLNTNDLIEFASQQKADSAGAVPCKYCNPSTIMKEISTPSSQRVVRKTNLQDNNYVSGLRWLNDNINGEDCQVQLWSPWTEISYSIWSGECKNGKAHGEGMLQLFSDERLIWNVNASESKGVLLEEGRLSFAVDKSRINIVQYKCSHEDNLVNISVDDAVDISQDLIAKELLLMGAKFGHNNCPEVKKISVILDKNPNNDHRWRGTYHANIYGTFEYTDRLNGKEYDNKIGRSHLQEIKREWEDAQAEQRRIAKADRQRRKEELRAKQEDLRAKAKREAKDKAKARLSEFYVKNNAIAFMSETTTPSIDELFANPFVYEDKTIVVVVNFEQMQSATSAIFSVAQKGIVVLPPMLVVSSIPKGMFKVASAKYFLAGNVLGNTELVLPLLGQTQVPHLKFVDVLFANK